MIRILITIIGQTLKTYSFVQQMFLKHLQRANHSTGFGDTIMKTHSFPQGLRNFSPGNRHVNMKRSAQGFPGSLGRSRAA